MLYHMMDNVSRIYCLIQKANQLSLSDSQWQELVAQFESGLTEAADIAGQTRLAESYSTFEEPGSGTGPLTLLELIVNLAVHNAYHLGRIVQLRQISGCWPPPAGGDTW